MPTKLIVAAVSVIAWIITVVVLYQTGHDGWGYFAIVIPLGTVLGMFRNKKKLANRISVVGVKSPAGLACPNCGGTQFTARRTLGGIFAMSFFAPKTRVQCVTCGHRFTRG
jgi:hypothetical protein